MVKGFKIWLRTYRFSYSIVETKAENASGFISRCSRSLYMLLRKASNCRRDSTSDAKPVSPMYNFSETGKTCTTKWLIMSALNKKNYWMWPQTFSKFMATVWACAPRRKSLQTTQTSKTQVRICITEIFTCRSQRNFYRPSQSLRHHYTEGSTEVRKKTIRFQS